MFFLSSYNELVASSVTVFRTMAFTEEFMPKDLIKAESQFSRVGAFGGECHMILRGQTAFCGHQQAEQIGLLRKQPCGHFSLRLLISIRPVSLFRQCKSSIMFYVSLFHICFMFEYSQVREQIKGKLERASFSFIFRWEIRVSHLLYCDMNTSKTSLKGLLFSWAKCKMPLILALGELRQKDHYIQVRLDYLVSLTSKGH